jgi:hypothetical protein
MHKEISALYGSRWNPLEGIPKDSVSAIPPLLMTELSPCPCFCCGRLS